MLLRFRLAFTLMLCLPVFADEPEYRDGQRIWHLTDYLNGTADEVGSTLNKELNRLAAHLQELTLQRDAAQKAVQQYNADTARRFESNAQRLALSKELVAAEETLATARKSGTSQEKLDAGAKCNALKAQIEALRKTATALTPAMEDTQRSASQLNVDISRCEQSIGTAESWKQELLSATQNTFRLGYPLDVGSNGILGEVTVERVEPDGTIVAEYQAPEERAVEGEKEGVITIAIRYHPVTLTITGTETALAKTGGKLTLDENYQVVSRSRGEERQLAVTVKRKPNDVDKLLSRMAEKPRTLTDADLANFTKAAAAKTDPHGWKGVGEILRAVPATIRPPNGKGPWTPAEVRDANAWLSGAVAGDKFETVAYFDSGHDATALGVQLEAHCEDGPNAAIHHLTLNCPAAQIPAANKFRSSRKATITGVIANVTLSPTGELHLELRDVKF